MRNIIINTIILILLINHAYGLGVSPSRVDTENLMRGSSFQKEIYLSGVLPGETIDMSIEGGMKDWISISGGNRFEFKEMKSMPVTIRIDVPKDVENGRYTSSIRISTLGKNSEEKQNEVSIISGVTLSISGEITGEQIKDYRIRSIAVPVTEEGQDMKFVMRIENNGNVIAKPSSLKIEVLDKYKIGQYFLKNIKITDGVAPHSESESTIFLENRLGPGDYWAILEVMDGDKTIYNDEIIIEVVEEGYLSKEGILLDINIPESISTGQTLKIDSVFSNTGLLAVKAKFYGEIYRDDNLVEMIESEPMEVEKGKKGHLISYFSNGQKGTYEILGYVTYAGKRTKSIKKVFSVSDIPITAHAIKQYETAFNTVPITVLALSMLGALIIFRKKKYKCEDCLSDYKLRVVLGKKCKVCGGRIRR